MDKFFERFLIDGLQPIGNNFWKASISIRSPETIEGRGVAQVTTVTVRFKYDHAGDAQGLLQRARDEAQRCLALATDVLRENSLPDLLSELERDDPLP